MLPDDRFAAESFAPGAVLLRRYALADADAVLAAVAGIAACAPLRHMVTPGGAAMSVAMTNCGTCGWISDRKGYRYAQRDPLTGETWPALPGRISDLASRAAAAAGYPAFVPDACLINRYVRGSRMSLHQDRDEADFAQPIVSVSLGVPATFLFGGRRRADAVQRLRLEHGDVVVWGGPSRLNYHGIARLATLSHPAVGEVRWNLTLRRAA